MRYWRLVVWGGVAVATGTVFAVAAGSGELSDAAMLTTVLGFGISASGLALNLARAPSHAPEPPPPDEVLSARADRLADAVRRQWQTEWRLRRLQDPEPMAIHWTSAEPWLADELDHDEGELPDASDGIATALEQAPSQRLVVIGEPGSGKTVLCVRFLLEVLEGREPGGPVPVLFPLSDWRPQSESLDTWLARYTADHYPGASWARELLDAARVIPVLDGLDELPGPLRTTALRRLNADLDDGRPVLLTCRSDVYADVVRAGDVLTSAAVVELQALPFEIATRYLLRTARPVRGADGRRATRWHPVVERLRATPGVPPCAMLRAVLRTPLMVTMVRTVHEDSDADPMELLDRPWPDLAALEAHLLDAFVPAAFRDDTHRLDRTLDALAFLARHLERRHTRTLAWWELRRELPWPLREWGPLLLFGSVLLALVLAATGPRGGWTFAFIGALLVPVCVGQTVFLKAVGWRSNRPSTARLGRVPGELVLLTAGAVILGVGVGVCSSLDGRRFSTDPVRFEHLGVTALALIGGLALATVLAVLGLLGDPAPVIVPLSVGRASRPWRWGLGTLLVLLAAGLGALLPAAFFLGVQLIVVCAVFGGLGAALAIWRYPHTDVRSPGGGGGARHLPSRGRRRAFAGLSRGLAAGLLLGVAFGAADAATLAGRSATYPEFPSGGVWSSAADGRSVLVTPDGWKHLRLPDGTRVAITPGPIDWTVDRWHDGVLYAQTTDEPCYGSCDESLHRPVELEIRPGREDLLAKLPDGTLVLSSDLENEMPLATAEWLLRGTPGALFGQALGAGVLFGLSLGLVGGATAALHRRLVTPAEVTQVGTPLDGLRADRATAVSRGVLFVLCGLLGTTLVTYAPQPLRLDVWDANGNISGAATFVLPAVAPFAVVLSAWGWFLVTRLWLCGTGRLPWRLMAFLEEAHRRGVLRQTGALYEFRHARLQERLAAWPVADRPT
jgi:hypothetical protein